MKAIFCSILILTFVFLPLWAEEKKCDLEKEMVALEKAALNYIEGWYEGNPERMAEALHPELQKKGVLLLKETGKYMLNPAGYSKMIELTRVGFGKKVPAEKRNIHIKILDISKRTACVKTVSVEYIDYLQLVKLDGQWKIVHVLWERNNILKKSK